MMGIIHADYWRQARADYMEAARACREALTRREGYWRYERTDPRVKRAVAAYVKRARNAHAFALGRQAVIEDFTYINPNEPPRQGALFAR